MKQNRLISIGAFILVLALSGLMTGCMEKDVYDPNREKVRGEKRSVSICGRPKNG